MFGLRKGVRQTVGLLPRFGQVAEVLPGKRHLGKRNAIGGTDLENARSARRQRASECSSAPAELGKTAADVAEGVLEARDLAAETAVVGKHGIGVGHLGNHVAEVGPARRLGERRRLDVGQ